MTCFRLTAPQVNSVSGPTRGGVLRTVRTHQAEVVLASVTMAKVPGLAEACLVQLYKERHCIPHAAPFLLHSPRKHNTRF